VSFVARADVEGMTGAEKSAHEKASMFTHAGMLRDRFLVNTAALNLSVCFRFFL
jgi:hypothetical protein